MMHMICSQILHGMFRQYIGNKQIKRLGCNKTASIAFIGQNGNIDVGDEMCW